MRTKVIAALLALLTALGGLNLFQSIKKKLQPTEGVAMNETREYRVDAPAQSDARAREYRIDIQEKAAQTREYRVKVESAQAVVTERGSRSGEVVIDKTFEVRNGEFLDVEIVHADVNITTNTTDQVQVKVRLDGRDMTRAKAWFDAMEFDVFQDGNRVVVVARSPRNNWNNRNSGGARINVDVSMPSEFNVNMQTTHGDVVMGDLRGDVLMRTSHGDVELQNIRGREVAITTSHGDIKARNLLAELVELRTSHSDINLGTVVSRRFKAHTSHSDVNVEDVSGETEIRTSHGDIRANVSGSESASFVTSHGDVTVYTARDSKADLDLSGAKVRVSSEFTLSGDVRKDRVDARINGGGPLLHARTTHGSVDLRPRS